MKAVQIASKLVTTMLQLSMLEDFKLGSLPCIPSYFCVRFTLVSREIIIRARVVSKAETRVVA